MPIQVPRAGAIHMKKFAVFEMVNNLIIERMEKDVIPWLQNLDETGHAFLSKTDSNS